MKLHRLFVSSSQRLPSSMSNRTLPPLIFNLSLSLPVRRKFCGCSIPITVDEIDENDNNMNKKGIRYPGKPVKSSSLVKPKLVGNWKWARIIRKYQCAKGMWTMKLKADNILEGFRKPGMWVWGPFWFWCIVCMLF